MSNLFLYQMHKEIIRCVDYSMSLCVSFSFLKQNTGKHQRTNYGNEFFSFLLLLKCPDIICSNLGSCIDEKYK